MHSFANTPLSNHFTLNETSNEINSLNNVSSNLIQSPKLRLGLNASIILRRNPGSNANLNNDESSSNLTPSSPVICNSRQDSSNPMNSTPNTANLPSATPSTSTQIVTSNSITSSSAKEYVESLHQNSKTQLIYGKNHVVVQPVF